MPKPSLTILSAICFYIACFRRLTGIQIDLPNTRDQVPLGSSSASINPGYSPVDHVYGQAAMQYGSAAAKAKAEGIELRPHADLEYEIGQGKGHKRKKLAEMQLPKGSQDNSGGASGSGADAPSALTNGKKPDSENAEDKDEDMGDAAQPSFYIDTNPTPVNLPFSEKNDSKRATSVSEPLKENKSKKSKKAHDGELPAAPAQGKIETEDISAEVDARMKEKEEKRLKKEEKKRKKEAPAAETGETVIVEEPDTSIVAAEENKKRKRESAGSSTAIAAVADADTTVNGGGEEVKKPKKKKSKKEKDVESSAKIGEDAAQNEPQPSSEPALPTGSQKSSEANGKKKKKSKKDNEKVVEQGEDIQPAQTESKKRSTDEAGEGEGKKKRKKRKLEEEAAD